MQANYIPGMPRRMGAALSALFAREGYAKHREKLELIGELQNETHLLSMDAPEAAIFQMAEAAQREIYRYIDRYKVESLILDGIYLLCERLSVARPAGAEAKEIIARAVDRAWWIRGIRKAHSRRFEHNAIRLGFTNYRQGPYISNESAQRQAARNLQNQKLLQSIELQNEFGQVYNVAELADKGMANKANRRGELMTRIRGFEEVAFEAGHVGIFWTQTAPSKYHAVLSQSGRSNPKYIAFGSPTPRQAQKYLCGVWQKQRAALHRAGIRPYGFRIAEPHHDGCPHWHMLLFVAPEHEKQMVDILRRYALEEDSGEWAKEENRAKLVRIESGAVAGKASGYIAKYVAKNIDGEHVGEHHMREDGKTYIVAPDGEITPSQRVTYWSQTWGIRQFQMIGGAPVGVWRELRKIKAETIEKAPEAIKAAWRAVQSLKATETNIVDGKPVKTEKTVQQASWSDFLRAMGGVAVGRNGAIQIARRLTKVEGRYATYDEEKPCGVYLAKYPGAVYESVRYTWTRIEKAERVEVRGVGVPWTGVNNCTGRVDTEFTRWAAETLKNQKICSAGWVFERAEGESIEFRKPGPEEIARMRAETRAGRDKTRSDMERYRAHRKNAAALDLAAHRAHLDAKYREV